MYHDTGEVASITHYEEGKQVGKIIYYPQNDKKVIQVKNSRDVNVKDLIETKDGILLNKSNKKPYTGNIVEFYKSGELNSKGYVKNGEPEGYQVTYNKNGQVRLISSFKDGKVDLKNILFYKNGKFVKN